MSKYTDFLNTKTITFRGAGLDCAQSRLHQSLFAFQKDIVCRALKCGRFAVFADCGLGKSRIQLEWARIVCEETGGNVLIVAPLSVAEQTKREAELIGIDAAVCRTADDLRGGVNITNYEMIHKFDPAAFNGIVLDESSILKSYDGKTRKLITDFADGMSYRLACTATPAPNDTVELINHAEFLGIMRGKEMLALFFRQDGNTTHAWRLKRHAEGDFWKWISSWAVAIRKPSDLGYPDDRFILPPLNVAQVTVGGDDGFTEEAKTLQERRNARRESMPSRIAQVAQMVNASSDQWILWCDLNAESVALTSAIADAVEITGSDSSDTKLERMAAFISGEARVLVSKPSICGFGVNLQNCHNVAFVGLSDSWEQYYQAIRRCWRFGQKNAVDCYIITSAAEGAVLRNIERKESSANAMFDELVKHMNEDGGQVGRQNMLYETETVTGDNWTLYLGDSVNTIKNVADESIGLSIFSPPFPGMYAYTNSPNDMGNVKDFREMVNHFSFLIPELYRITMPGRSCCVHLTQGVAFKGADGYIGIKDFRGEIIRSMEERGWIYYGEVAIEKCPQLKAIRTKDAGLLFKSLATDSARMHMALADYVIQFRKPGDNAVPIRAGISEKYGNPEGWITSEEWIEWAAPVWFRQTPQRPNGIRESNVLRVQAARDDKDEKHLCPLQLDVIERCVKLWSAPGETIYSPFAGIGSEGHVALSLNRKFIGGELKRSYFNVAKSNLEIAASGACGDQQDMFAAAESAL